MNSVDGAGAESLESHSPKHSSGVFSVWGDIRLRGDALVQALVKGNVRAEQKLVLTSAASVSGWVQGGDVCVEGKIEGGLEAQGRVWLKKGAIVWKQCVARSLRVEPGAHLRGELRVGE